MRLVSSLALGIAVVGWAVGPRRELPTVQPNPNTSRAGVLHGGVLTLALEAKQVRWQPDGPDRAAMTMAAFAEEGRSPLMPGPLVRVPQGTKLRLSLRNSLTSPLTFFVPAAVRGVQSMVAEDSVIVAPGTVRLLTTRAVVPGNYLYRAASPSASDKQTRIAGALAGAIVIDTAGATTATRDRVFVIMETPDPVVVAFADTAHETTKVPRSRRGLVTSPIGRFLFTINGRSWPKTERVAATVGDSLHWRIINASADDHPMHLHGFYYRVDAFAGPYAESQGPPARGQMVVTQLLSPFSTMSMTWLPDRPANWIFHCHFALHLMPDSISAAPNDPYMRGMVGLILGINVADRPGRRAARAPTPKRHLRLIAIRDTGFPDSAASMRFVLEEHGRLTQAGTAFSPTIDLTRGEPVSIMIVNHLDEPTSVHWHGIEVEDSYVDGVPGVSGTDRRVAAAIAPGDSFEARFTPPRSGTFIYHAHIDEVREQQAGLEGALIVRDLGDAPSPDDHVFFLKGSRFGPDVAASPLEINGETNPDTIVLHAGRPARLRFISLASISPNATVWFTARNDSAFRNVEDTMVVRWRPIAKDGASLPLVARGERLARQDVGMGETYDFEYAPSRRGTMRLEVRALSPPRGGGVLLARVPIRIE